MLKVKSTIDPDKQVKNKTISVKLKSFTTIGVLVISGSILLSVSVYFNQSQSYDYILSTFKATSVFVIIGIILCYMGAKTRNIIFLEEKIEYKTSKTIFSARYDEINLIKTFKDPANNSQNLLIFVETNNSLALSSSFFSIDKLHETYIEILNRSDIYIKNNELTIENELNW